MNTLHKHSPPGCLRAGKRDFFELLDAWYLLLMAELTTRYYKTTGTGGEYLVDLFDDNTLWEWSIYEGRDSGWGGTWAKELHLKEWYTVFAIGDKEVRFILNEGVEDGVWVNLTPVPVLRKVE